MYTQAGHEDNNIPYEELSQLEEEKNSESLENTGDENMYWDVPNAGVKHKGLGLPGR